MPRKSLLEWLILAAIIAVAVVNGRPFSPYFDAVLFWLGKIAGRAYAASPLVFHATSAVLTMLTLLVAAVPALVVRLAIGPRSIVPATVWFVAAWAASWPALRVAFGLED